MKKIFLLLPLLAVHLTLHAQKKNKGKTNTVITDSAANYIVPVSKSKGKKGRVTSDSTGYTKSVKKSKGKKDDKKDSKTVNMNYTPDVVLPKPDSSKKFTGVIKYRITSDDPADIDSVIIVFGESQIKATMFIPGYRADQVFEKSMIADLKDSTFFELDNRTMTYTTEKLTAKNEGTEFTLIGNKKIGQILNLSCQEYAGEMTTAEGDVYQASCLVSSQHSYIYAMDYNFMNIHPLVLGYKIVLGFRTRSAENENTYIIAYKIEPGNTASWFDLSKYHPK